MALVYYGDVLDLQFRVLAFVAKMQPRNLKGTKIQ
jgi:hypothetical protein